MKIEKEMLNEQQTIELAENLESEKFRNMVICLNGDLGAGKTAFTQAFANALGIEETITSPTFNIVKEYAGELNLYHMDVYRLEKSDPSLVEYFTRGGVTIIEWADTIKDILPEERLDITIKITGENKRLFILEPHGEKYINICEESV